MPPSQDSHGSRHGSEVMLFKFRVFICVLAVLVSVPKEPEALSLESLAVPFALLGVTAGAVCAWRHLNGAAAPNQVVPPLGLQLAIENEQAAAIHPPPVPFHPAVMEAHARQIIGMAGRVAHDLNSILLGFACTSWQVSTFNALLTGSKFGRVESIAALDIPKHLLQVCISGYVLFDPSRSIVARLSATESFLYSGYRTVRALAIDF